MKITRSTTLTAAFTLLVVGGLAACDNQNQTTGQKVDEAVSATESKANEVKDDVKSGTAEATSAVKDAGASVKQVIDDVAITTGVKAELAKDTALSALAIDVDTKEGRVSLSGTAPDDAAKARATQLAAGINGVMSVDNRLTVK